MVTVSGISPDNGPLSGGTNVTISGSGFSVGIASVTVGGAAATSISVQSDTSLTCVTPSGSAGAADVVVTDVNSDFGTLTSGYTFVPAPSVSGVSPSSGPAVGGTSVTVSGSDFTSGASVTFDGNAATSVSVVNSTTITCTTPAGSSSVTVRVTNSDSQYGELASAYTYVPAPSVSGVSPTSGPEVGGTAVTLTGTGFLSGATVDFGATAATGVSVVSATSITCTAPAGTGTVGVTVTNSDTQTDTLANAYTYIAKPVVSSIAPTSGPEAGGTSVTVTGTGFRSGASVSFGATAATGVSVASATSITCTAPAGTGTVGVTVTNDDSQTHTLASAYSYVPAPTVSGVSPSSGPAVGGTSVTVSGTGFLSGASVTFDGNAATSVSVVSATWITCTTPAGSGNAAVRVTNPDTQYGELSSAYTYVPAPTVSGVSPSSGPVGGGTSVTISGSDFTSGASVTFDGNAATSITFVNSTTITCATPAGSGSVTVRVTNSDGQYGELGSAYSYIPAPTVSGVSPSSGPAVGGTSVTVSGTGFLSGVSVTFDGNAATSVSVVNSTTITCTTPAGSGSVTVRVTNSDSQYGELSNAYTYVPAPSVSGLSPGSGPQVGGTSVTVSGSNFSSGASVTFDGNAASSVSVVNSTTITCTTPSGSGNAAVRVTNSDSQYGELSAAFTYVPAPSVSGVSPGQGSTGGGTAVVVSGSNFDSGSGVSFGGSIATVTGFTSMTIDCTTGAHSPATVDVVVTNSDGQTGTLTNGYIYALAPTVSGISPGSGPVSGGTSVTVSGANFSSGASVAFDGSAATSVTVVNSTTITCTTPAGSGAVSVRVTNTDSQYGELSSAFTYVPAPTVSGVSPSSGPAVGGTSVTVSGSNFGSGASVTFDGNAATGVTIVDSSNITCTTPAGSGNATVRVTDTYSQYGELSNAYTYVPAPSVSGVMPNFGPAVGNTDVAVLGSNFTSGASVTFNGNAATDVGVTSDTQINCKTPAGSGDAAVRVTNSDSQYGELSNAYTYVPAPSVSGVSPGSGPAVGGTNVTVSGSNFISGASVSFDGNAATGVTFINSTTINCETPAGSGVADVRVTNPDTQYGELADAYTYIPAPTVISFTPMSGPEVGGTGVEISGSNFVTGATVTFGSHAATGVTVVNSSTITCTSPPGTGAVSITVTNPDGQMGGAGDFSYIAAPIVMSITPNSGPTEGGTSVTITGDYFENGATVKFGGVSATDVTFNGTTSLTCLTPAGIEVVDVTVVNPDGQSGTLPGAFVYIGDPDPSKCQECSEDFVSPAGSTCPAFSGEPIRYDNGGIQLFVNDLSAAGFGQPWGHVRSFVNSGSGAVDYGNGYNWQIVQWPFLLQSGATITVFKAGSNSLWFDYASGAYTARYGVHYTLTTGSGTLVLTSPSGRRQTFFDFAQGTRAGKLSSQTTPGGESISLSYDAAGNCIDVERSVTEDDIVLTESYVYEYGTADDAARIISVTLCRQVGSDGSWYPVRRALYTYYQAGNPDGNAGDLQRVVRQVPQAGTSWADESTDYYRYYTSTAGGIGLAHGLKYVVGPEAFVRLSAAVGDPFIASDQQVASFADNYFQYDDQGRATLETVAAGTQTTTFSYLTNDDPSYEDGPNNWKTKTVETMADGSQIIIFANGTAQEMLSERRNADGTQRFITYQQFDDDYNVVLVATPSAINLAATPVYDPSQLNLDVQLLADAGLVYVNDYYDGTTGVPAGYLKTKYLQEGTGGTPIKQEAVEYASQSAGGQTIYPLAGRTVYRSDTSGGSDPVTTGYDYLYYSGTFQKLQKTTTLPTVPTDQNGSGAPCYQREQYDIFGNMTWEQGPRGFIDYFSYDVVTGALVQMIADVDPEKISLPSGWTRPEGLPTPLHLITDYETDDQGRQTQSLGPVHNIDGVDTRQAGWAVYHDAAHEVWSALGFATGPAASYVYTLVNPVTIRRNDHADRVVDQIEAARRGIDGRLAPTDCFPQASWTAWSRNIYDDAGRLITARAYHTIPCADGCCAAPSERDGSLTQVRNIGYVSANYDDAVYGYDLLGRRNCTVTPGGTITRQTFDLLDRTLSEYIGTNDAGATDSDPTGGNGGGNTVPSGTGNNLVQTIAQVFPAGCDCSQPQQQTLYIDGESANNRVTTFELDFRNRVTAIDGEIDFYQVNTYDNLDRVVQVDRYDTDAAGNLIGRSTTSFDNRGRVYQTAVYGVDPSTGTVGNVLIDNTWYDEARNVIKQVKAGSQAFTKTQYDSRPKPIATFVGLYTGDGDEPYSEVGIVTDDNLIYEQSQTTYDAADNAVESASLQRFHNAIGNGELQPPEAGEQPAARPSYQAVWYDGAGRSSAAADYGTYGNTAFTRPDTVPLRSDDVLVVTYGYDSSGNRFQTIDADGRESRQAFNALRRTVLSVANFVANDVGSTLPWTDALTPENSTNVAVSFSYNADGNLVVLTAYNPATGDQTTRYEYGTTLTDSAIARHDLLRSTVYPDAVDGEDRIVQAYNRQGQATRLIDQNGTTHDYDYDLLGRSTDDRITTLGSGIDGAIRRLAKTYDIRGLVETVSSYDATIEGDVVNQVQSAYNDFRQLIAEYQAHDGSVNTSSSPKVQYSYADGSANTVRLTSLTYPNGRAIGYDYGTTDSGNDRLSRVESLLDTAGSTTSYEYFGLSSFLTCGYSEPSVVWSLNTGSGSNPYAALDRFGRPLDCAWKKSSTYLSRVKYTYDRASSRTSREVTGASGNDELYSYDGLQRLLQFTRGDLTVAKDKIDSVVLSQQWRLDATGNWKTYQNLDFTTPADSIDQTRSANRVNEITSLTSQFGASWAQCGYDRTGNMTTLPQPNEPAESYAATYDAWNRMIELRDGATVVADCDYDGLNRRTIVDDGATERHSYYSTDWRLLEERLGETLNSAPAERQFVWGLRYIDDLILRDRSPTNNGMIAERLYALQDANWNVTALADDTGGVVERFRYDAYGQSSTLAPNYEPTLASEFDWEVRYSGYRLDIPTALYLVRWRQLNPSIGAWLTRDPIGYLASLNLYLYASGTPVSDTDAFGLFPVDPQGIALDDRAIALAPPVPGIDRNRVVKPQVAPQANPNAKPAQPPATAVPPPGWMQPSPIPGPGGTWIIPPIQQIPKAPPGCWQPPYKQNADGSGGFPSPIKLPTIPPGFYQPEPIETARGWEFPPAMPIQLQLPKIGTPKAAPKISNPASPAPKIEPPKIEPPKIELPKIPTP